MYSWRILIGVCVISLATGGLTGYALKSQPPARVEYRDKDVIKYRDAETRNVKVATVSAPVIKTIYRDRTITKPGGVTIVDRWHERTDTGEVKTNAEEQTVIIREVEKIRDVVRIETRAPDWSAAILAGTDVALQLQLAAQVSYRVVGPFFLVAEVVVPTKAPEDAAVFGGGGFTF